MRLHSSRKEERNWFHFFDTRRSVLRRSAEKDPGRVWVAYTNCLKVKWPRIMEMISSGSTVIGSQQVSTVFNLDWIRSRSCTTSYRSQHRPLQL